MKNGKVWVGTSGWLYKHWKGTFYPPGLKAKDEFEFYSLFFNTLEVNNTFYKLPSRITFSEWKKITKPNFLYAIKGGGFITHRLKLKNPDLALDRFFEACTALEEKLGVILFQLHPEWKRTDERFERLKYFLEILPKDYRYTIEFRHQSWYHADVYTLLKKHNCAFCIYQLAGHISPIEITADFIYVRLHGPTENKYQGNYDFNALKLWAEKSRKWQAQGKDVFFYFDNDDSGYAAFNAQVLEMMLNKTKPITRKESEVLEILISAIKQRKSVRFRYEKHWKETEPYLIGIDKKGKGDLFVVGGREQYVLGMKDESNPKNKTNHHLLSGTSPRAGSGSGLSVHSTNNGVRFLLTKIVPQNIAILEDISTHLKINERAVYRPPASIRVVYRTVLRSQQR